LHFKHFANDQDISQAAAASLSAPASGVKLSKRIVKFMAELHYQNKQIFFKKLTGGQWQSINQHSPSQPPFSLGSRDMTHLLLC
jgi:hypothetical protein